MRMSDFYCRIARMQARQAKRGKHATILMSAILRRARRYRAAGLGQASLSISTCTAAIY